ncbi:tyrosine-type recombinase/integrase [Ottowia sp.]|uniref:tyrosine-type recombinase/integrase n=1 Tax=Ottowia sp. TaxID=1898956 RepID=UPI002B77D58D|nr:tyrosine-type recombinase/integrase [Ottowia sp.]HOB65815.1 tyrosine-type recombinase/integrase [Ottowia sp.]HPZ57124.1 tyrosine-type recombinase/integrase [Ottowia sp.]HQD46821.1 tyrosine-type recombinase/integrase [Ottowia sp.]
MPIINTVAGRDKLKPRREPYWHKVSTGCFLGFRKQSQSTAGTWVARWRDDTGKQQYRALGAFDDLPPNARFDAAMRSANQWLTHVAGGGRAKEVTVRSACERYVAHLRAEKTADAADDADKRFQRHVYTQPIAAIAMDKLRPIHVDTWRKRLQDGPKLVAGRKPANQSASPKDPNAKRSAATLNRDMTCLRAALNLAYRDQIVLSDAAWSVKLLPIKKVGGRRTLYLDRDQRQSLIDHMDADLAQFARAMSNVPLRPGALAALTVGRYDKRLRALHVGSDKAGADRSIVLPATTAAQFEQAAASKLPGALLFTRGDGAGWDKDKWKWPVKAAAAAAELPAETTLYTLRHSVITDLVVAGVDLFTVAKLAGTSVRMIEEHYGHLRSDVTAFALEKVALN